MSDSTVTLPAAEYEALKRDAAAWHLLSSSPHVVDVLAEWLEWDRRRELSESTAAMAAMHDWRALANAPTYAQLQRRRTTYDTPALTPNQIRNKAAEPWSTTERRAAA